MDAQFTRDVAVHALVVVLHPATWNHIEISRHVGHVFCCGGDTKEAVVDMGEFIGIDISDVEIPSIDAPFLEVTHHAHGIGAVSGISDGISGGIGRRIS